MPDTSTQRVDTRPTSPGTWTQPPPATSTDDDGGGPLVVHPGAFCSTEGALGVTDEGTPMVCGPG